MTPTAEHPNPMLRRADWVDLCGEWAFAHDDDDVGRRQRWHLDPSRLTCTITVPFPPESQASGVGDPAYHPVVWYHRTVEVAAGPGERVILHFGAVDYRATVWVDGQKATDHEGGHSSFSLDVTDLLSASAEHDLVVRAEDDPTDPGQPRGKQDWKPEPHGIWYDRTTGIWQPVWLEVLPTIHLVEAVWTADLAGASVRGELTLSAAHESTWVDVILRVGEELLAETRVKATSSTLSVDLAVPALLNAQDRWRLLWTPESPTLVDVSTTVRSAVSEDRSEGYLGLRSAGFRDGRFLLNGMPYYLRLVLEQGYWPESHLAAPSGEALRREVELIKELGFNGARIHQKVEDPRFLSWCDRLGLLVWGEMAATYEFSPTAMERTTREWLDVVRRDRGHPCIVTWVPLNESWGVPEIATEVAQQDFATALYHLTRALDPTRPVISNDGWEHTVSDIWGVHDYTPRGESLHARFGSPEALEQTLRGAGPGRRRVLLLDGDHRGQPVVVTEFGGLSLAPRTGEKWFGYGTVETTEELLAGFGDLVGALLDCEDVAGFCYTQLTDTLQERNGLLTEAREPKLPVAAVHEILTAPSRAIASEEVDAHRRQSRRQASAPAAEKP